MSQPNHVPEETGPSSQRSTVDRRSQLAEVNSAEYEPNSNIPIDVQIKLL